MSIYLHPSAFVETTGECSGPRRIRSQPSRESGGVLLNECDAKYQPKFELPTRNIRGFIASLQNQWDKVPTNEKDLIKEDLKNMFGMRGLGVGGVGNAPIQSSPDLLTFLRDYVSLEPEKRTKEVLDALYYHPSTVKEALNEDTRNKMSKSLKEWADDQSLFFHFNLKTLIFIFILCCLFLFVGITIQKNQK